MLAGILVSLLFWWRLARHEPRLLVVYAGGLVGAFFGAKVVYVIAEGWQHFGAPDMWLQLATGKSILGALLGGYAGVELAKHLIHYSQPTGDRFASIAPVGIMLGRVGCLLHGCCLGIVCQPHWYALRDVTGAPRWPAVPVEILFNAVAVLFFVILRRKGWMTGQHFHLYLIGYGLFRFAHEFARATPKVLSDFSGYQVAAITVVFLGVVGFGRRRFAQGVGGHRPPLQESGDEVTPRPRRTTSFAARR